MAEQRWVFVENLGPRVNWQSIKRKALEALGGATEASVKGGRMDRHRRAAVIEFSAADEAEKVAQTFDGYFDKVTSKSEDDTWRASPVTEAESAERMEKLAPCGGGAGGGGRPRSSSPPRRRAPSPPVARGPSPRDRRRSRSRSRRSSPRRRSPPPRRGGSPPGRRSPRRGSRSRGREHGRDRDRDRRR
mmetsp:Transcript_118766/g.298711  ORF Transcript_118766/g.298711 Transcript_118766/m.298711 type:complete len:189 (-) Transcript_118766:45-611(-)